VVVEVSGAGGGGAGGYRTTFPSPGCNAGAFPISATTYPITVGAGGAGAAGSSSGNIWNQIQVFQLLHQQVVVVEQ
jgi:hypothetical protein